MVCFGMDEAVHFGDMLKERRIKREWAERTVEVPDRTEDFPDGTRHYLKQIPEFGNRWLRVIVSTAATPPKQLFSTGG